MTALPEASAVTVEQRKDAALMLGMGSLGFLLLGLVALLESLQFHGDLIAHELLVAGAIGTAVGIFLIVAVLAVWFDRGWVGQWHG